MFLSDWFDLQNSQTVFDQSLPSVLISNRLGNKTHGDLIAHLAEISDRTIWRSASQEPNENAFEALTIVGESEASKDLEDTISIIATLTSKAVESGGLSSAQLP